MLYNLALWPTYYVESAASIVPHLSLSLSVSFSLQVAAFYSGIIDFTTARCIRDLGNYPRIAGIISSINSSPLSRLDGRCASTRLDRTLDTLRRIISPRQRRKIGIFVSVRRVVSRVVNVNFLSSRLLYSLQISTILNLFSVFFFREQVDFPFLSPFDANNRECIRETFNLINAAHPYAKRESPR